MYVKELELEGLELVDPNADYSGTQTIFIDFDGANDVSYDNDALNIHIDNLSVAHSGLSEEDQFQIITDLNNTFADTGVTFTVTAPTNEEYSTIYVGGNGSAFSEYGSFLGLSETIDAGNQIKNDEAFVFSDKISSTSTITETITHEAGHLLGFEHTNDKLIDQLNDFAIEDLTAPSVPVEYTLTLTGNSITSDWVDSTDESGIMEYQIQSSFYSDFREGEDTVNFTTEISTITVNDLEEGEYFWRIRAVDNNNNASDWSEVANFSTMPNEVTKLIATDGEDYDSFATSVSIDGDNIVIGASSQSGSAYVYCWNGTAYDEIKLTASDAAAADYFGDSVAIDGDNIVIGASWDNDNGFGSGSAYVYRWNGTTYDEIKLTASDGAAGDRFGWSVAIDGDNIVVGAEDDDDNGTGSGSAYVYRWNGTSYNEIKLTASNGEDYDYFGDSVAIDGDNIVIGAEGDGSGSAYVYRWNGTSYNEIKLTASDGKEFDEFGASVAIDGDNIVIGATGDDINGYDAGSAYVYRWNGTSYNEIKLTAWDGERWDAFGSSVAIDGDNIVVGASGDNDDDDGSAYIYHWNGTSYDETRFTASDKSGHDSFGSSVTIDGDKVVIGATGDENGISRGSAYIFDVNVIMDFIAPSSSIDYTLVVTGNSIISDWEDVSDESGIMEYQIQASFYNDFREGEDTFNFAAETSNITVNDLEVGGYYWRIRAINNNNDTGEWSFVDRFAIMPNGITKLTASDGAEEDLFGESVAIDGDNIVIGATGDDDNGGASGSAYVYRWNGTFYDESKLTASDATNADYFGEALAIDGDNIVVGAMGDDNDNGFNSGSAYVYRWDGTSYDEIKLTASDGEDNDNFGSSVAIDGDNIVVEAYGDYDSSSVYVYRWNGTSYDEIKLSALDGLLGNSLFNSVAIDGDNIVVGNDSESAYVYRWNGTTYDEIILTASDRVGYDSFGLSVAIDGDNIVVGAPLYYDDNGSDIDTGSAYVYRWEDKDGDTVYAYEQYKLTASDGAMDDKFGLSVAIDGDNIVVGADADRKGDCVYVYHWNGTSYDETKIIDPNFRLSCSALAIDGNNILIGARFNGENGDDAGSAYIFDLNVDIDFTAPSIPVDYTLTVDGNSITSDWEDATDDCGIKEYQIQSSLYDDFRRGEDTINLTTETSIITVNDLEAGEYFWRIRAVDNNYYASDWSEVGSFRIVPVGVTKLLASDGADYDYFGYSLAVDSDNLVIGAYGVDAGSAYAYRWNGTSYDVQQLTPFDGEVGDEFGGAVDIDGDNIVIGAHYDDDKGHRSGSAYAYRWNGTSYDEIKLTASDGNIVADFGYSVAIDGDNIVIGAQGDNNANGSASGSAYVYSWNGTDYDEIKLTASDGEAWDSFGTSLAIDSDNIVVGAEDDDDNGTDSGSAYVYNWNGLTYDETKLIASDGEDYDYFGSSIAIDDDNIVVGAPGEDNANGNYAGSAYVYRWNGTSYDEIKLTASDGAESDHFACAVAIEGDNIVVGAEGNNSAYVYHWNGTSYDEIKLIAYDGVMDDKFGWSVAIEGDNIAIGAYDCDDRGVDAGSAYVFDLSEIIDLTAPTVPTGLLQAVSEGLVALDWSDSSDADSGMKQYNIQVDNNNDFSSLEYSGSVVDNTLSLTELASGAYFWRVQAEDNAGNTSEWSNGTSFLFNDGSDGDSNYELFYGHFSGGTTDEIIKFDTDSHLLEISRNGVFETLAETGSGWSVAATGDLNGDGCDDILLANEEYNALGAWTMNPDGTYGWMNVGSLPMPEWQVESVVDLDGNGVDDMLLYWEEFNYYGAWLLDDGGNVSWRGFGQIADGWEIGGTGDFNGDNREDLYLVNSEYGAVGTWLMNEDANGISWQTIGAYNSNIWSIEGAGDFDGNGVDDLLLKWDDLNYLGAWELDVSGNISGWASFGQYEASSWNLSGIADVNGDGTDDILMGAAGSDYIGARLLDDGAVSGWMTIAS